MQLRDPGSIQDAIEALDSLRSNCVQCNAIRDVPTTPGETYEAGWQFKAGLESYLAWVAEAASQLGDLFVDDDLADAIYTQSLLQIQRVAPDSSAAWPLLLREIEKQAARLQAAQRRLLELKDFVEEPGDIVVPDTSALVRGTWFEDFDWKAELGLASSVRLVIPILVIEELDHLKDRERTTKAGDRARKVLKRLRTLCGAVAPRDPAPIPTRANVTVEVLLDDDLRDRGPRTDAAIIDQALYIEAITGRDVTLVCVDHSMEFRARRRGLRVVPMPVPNVDAGTPRARPSRP